MYLGPWLIVFSLVIKKHILKFLAQFRLLKYNNTSTTCLSLYTLHVEYGYSETRIEHRLKEHKPFIRSGFEYHGKDFKSRFSFNSKEIYKAIADFLITFNVLFNFSKQASAVVAYKTSAKVIPSLHLFTLIATFNLLGYISVPSQRWGFAGLSPNNVPSNSKLENETLWISVLSTFTLSSPPAQT